jgi:signal peptidase II
VRRSAPRATATRWRQLSVALALAILALDQLSKSWALTHLAPGRAAPFWPGLLDLQLVRNTGAAFSLFTNAPRVLGLVSLAVSVGVVVWLLRRPPRGLWEGLALGFLLGGALGNGLDRWRLGAVIDFLALVPIAFPVFNLADVAINLAVLCFLVRLSQSGPGDEDPHG